MHPTRLSTAGKGGGGGGEKALDGPRPWTDQGPRWTKALDGPKPLNAHQNQFDPSLVFQRARTCRNIRFGSKNRKTKSSSFLARAEYFSELELAEIYGSGQKTGKPNLQVL